MRDRLITHITRHFLPCAATVLGVQLRELTLWHWAQLAAHDSPYAVLGYSLDFGDLAVAVRVCQTKPGEYIEARPRRWHRRLWWKLKAALFAHRLDDEEKVFFDWLIYNLTPPERWKRKGSGSVNVPSWLYFMSQLIKYGMSEAEAWAMPVGRARCYLAALGVADGGPDFFTDEEVEELVTEGGYTLEQLGLA